MNQFVLSLVLIYVLFPQVTPKAVVHDLYITSPSTQYGYYIINTAKDPPLLIARGDVYRFFIDAPTNPFFIIYPNGHLYQDGIGGDFGKDYGAIIWEVPLDAPGVLSYVSGGDPYMTNDFQIVDNVPRLQIQFQGNSVPHTTQITLPTDSSGTLQFSIANVGGADLIILSPPVLLSVDPTVANLSPLNINTIPPDTSVTLDISFRAPFTATLVLSTNDVQLSYVVNIETTPSNTTGTSPCSWYGWDHWSTCSQLCGGGQMTRNQRCRCPASAGECVGTPGTQVVPCNLYDCNLNVKGLYSCSWDSWSGWSECSQLCGNGVKFRKMRCNCPHLKANEYDDSFCDGEQARETKSCNTEDCCNWSTFGPWSECTQDCPAGVHQRQQQCTCPSYAYAYGYDETSCSGNPEIQEEPCATSGATLAAQCCQWTFQDWSECAGTCSTGRQKGRSEECQCEGGVNGTCEGVPQQQVVECVDGEGGVTCPHPPEYWLTKSWPLPKTTLVTCANPDDPKNNQTWLDILTQPEDPTDPWLLLARPTVATLLSRAAGAATNPEVDQALNQSNTLLLHCDHFPRTQVTSAVDIAKILNSYLIAEPGIGTSAGNAALSENSRSGINDGSVPGESGSNMAVAVAVPITAVAVLAVLVWVGVRTWRKNQVVVSVDEDSLNLNDLQTKVRNQTLGEAEVEEEDMEPLDVSDLEELHL